MVCLKQAADPDFGGRESGHGTPETSSAGLARGQQRSEGDTKSKFLLVEPGRPVPTFVSGGPAGPDDPVVQRSG